MQGKPRFCSIIWFNSCIVHFTAFILKGHLSYCTISLRIQVGMLIFCLPHIHGRMRIRLDMEVPMKMWSLQVVKYDLVTKRDVVWARIDFCQFFGFISGNVRIGANQQTMVELAWCWFLTVQVGIYHNMRKLMNVMSLEQMTIGLWQHKCLLSKLSICKTFMEPWLYGAGMFDPTFQISKARRAATQACGTDCTNWLP